jgi:general secretion pathway protein K
MIVAVSLALYTVSLSRDMVNTSRQLLDKLQAKLEAGSVMEKVKYIGSTGRFSSWQLENLSGCRDFPLQLNLRGTPINTGNSELRLIDSAGRLGLWPPHPDLLKKLLLANSMKDSEADIVTDSLLDWIDADDLKRLNGAEKYYYRTEQSLAYQPRNDSFIQTLGELELIRGFRGKVFDLVKDEVIETASSAFNINTADAPLLAAALGIDLESARRLVQLREKKGVVSYPDIMAAGGNGLTLMDEYVTFFPSFTVALDIRTRINEAGDSMHAIVRFRPNTEKPFTVEKFDE